MELGWQQVALTVVAVLFLGWLVLQLWPYRPRRGALGAETRAARDRARAAKTPRERAVALCEAARLAAHGGGRWTAAAGFFLRAMKSDPTYAEAVSDLVSTFRKRRPRMLEKMLWRRLSLVPWDAEHRAVLREIASGLAGLYEREIRDKHRAVAMRRVASTFEA
jgi:hypothetical protein